MSEDDLLARLEAATEESWSLSMDIAMAVGWTIREVRDTQECAYFAYFDPDGHRRAVPHFTGSVDAALMLAPNGANRWGIEALPVVGFDAYWSRNNVPEGHWMVSAIAETAPLALCLAAMKARRKA